MHGELLSEISATDSYHYQKEESTDHVTPRYEWDLNWISTEESNLWFLDLGGGSINQQFGRASQSITFQHTFIHNPTYLDLEECLGKEVLKELREEENTEKLDIHVVGTNEAHSSVSEGESLEIIADSRAEQFVIGSATVGGEVQTGPMDGAGSEEEKGKKGGDTKKKTEPEMVGMTPGTEVPGNPNEDFVLELPRDWVTSDSSGARTVGTRV